MAQKKTIRKKKKTKKKGSFITLFWLLLLSIVVAVALLFLLASFGVFGSLPDETSLENPEKNLATEIITTDGKIQKKTLLQKLSLQTVRLLVSFTKKTELLWPIRSYQSILKTHF